METMPDGQPEASGAVTPAAPPAAEPVRRRYRLVVAYDGAAFSGWQKQKMMPAVTAPIPSGPEGLGVSHTNAPEPGVEGHGRVGAEGEAAEPIRGWRRTVQGVLEEAVIRAVQQPVNLIGASRTDAGVHARGQVAQFDAATRIPTQRLAQAINARLPEDVEVRHVEVAADDFNAIGGAKSKQYRYRIFNASDRPLHRRLYTYHCWWNLDVAAMHAAAQHLVGEHDFTALAGSGSPRKSNVRTIHHCHVERDELASEVHIVVAANGFLYNMVRILAGTLLEVGRGAMTAAMIDQALAQKDRRLAGPTLPPQGLWLEWIRYE